MEQFFAVIRGIHLSAPKNHTPEDILFTKDTPIFATSISKIRKYCAGVVHEIETAMMDTRWNVLSLYFQLSEKQVKEVKSCPHCFASLILED